MRYLDQGELHNAQMSFLGDIRKCSELNQISSNPLTFAIIMSSNNKEQLIKNMEGFGVEMSSYTEPESEDQEALRVLGEHGDINLRAQASIGLGNARYRDSEHQRDTGWYQEALALIEGRGNIEQIAQASIESENTGNTDSNDQSNTVRIDEEINADWIGEGSKPGM